MMHKYEVIIFWSDEDNSYIAEVPELCPDAWLTVQVIKKL